MLAVIVLERLSRPKLSQVNKGDCFAIDRLLMTRCVTSERKVRSTAEILAVTIYKWRGDKDNE
jgi:hypothetical protein